MEWTKEIIRHKLQIWILGKISIEDSCPYQLQKREVHIIKQSANPHVKEFPIIPWQITSQVFLEKQYKLQQPWVTQLSLNPSA